MPRRLGIIFRALSFVTLLEGILGLYGVALTIILAPINRVTFENLLGGSYSHFAPLLYLMGLANLLFDAMLLAAGVLLWKLQRKGLFLLLCTLIAEVVYFLGISAMPIFLDRKTEGTSRALSKTLGAITGFGNFALSLQVVTAFPIVAGILIFFAYRYLGIPARPIE